MAVAPSAASSTLKKSISDDERRWVIIGICLNKVLTPTLRKVLSNEIPKWYQTLLQPPIEIHKQTFKNFMKSMPYKLNYESINNNTAHKSPKSYDYAVKDAVSLAKLFMKPFMARFTGFDHTMDTSAVLSVICGSLPFTTSGAAAFAEKIRSDVRNNWAHCDFSYWTEPNFQTALKDIESFIKTVGLKTLEEKNVLDDIDHWRDHGKNLGHVTGMYASMGHTDKVPTIQLQSVKRKSRKLYTFNACMFI